MGDDLLDNVTPGGRPAPLGARGDHGAAVVRKEPDLRRVTGSARLLLVVLAGALLLYSAIAVDVVHSGRLAELDVDVATWIAGSMPTWAEWIARPFTWLGGLLGVTAVVTVTAVWLLSRRARLEATLVAVVAVGIQVLVFTGKEGYGRPRPDMGSAIALPSSLSFPSGHAAAGIAVFGLLGILAATRARTGAESIVAVCSGFGLGVLVGASRVVLNVHYVSDVIAGWCLGLAWLVSCLLAARLLARRTR